MPRAIVKMPLPVPWKTAKTLAAPPPKSDDGRADRVGKAGEPARHQRVIPRQKARLEDARRHLRWSDQRAGGHRLQRGRAGGFQNPRQMRGHRAGDAPCGGKGKPQQDHGAVERNVRLDGGGNGRLCACDRRQHQPVDRQADQDVRRCPRKAGVAPADGFRPHAVSGHPTVEAKPAIRVMPVIERRAASP